MKVIQIIDKLGEILVIKKWKPIGTILMFDREQDMTKLYYGTWTLTLKERSPIGVNPQSSENRFKTAGQQFGEKTHTLTINEMPSHNHSISLDGTDIQDGGACFTNNAWTIPQKRRNYNGQDLAQSTGGSQAHNNIHPVETVYFYKRTA